MKIVLIAIGKTDEPYIAEGISKYISRINKYVQFDIDIIPDLKNTKNMQQTQQKEKEGELILKKIQNGDLIVLLDEKGKSYSSIEFAKWLNSVFITGYKRILFIIGGPYGFSNDIYKKCNHKISISRMTFSHQMIRLIFTEQFYRANSILKGEPYHHE
jgi:23S rRNA (pseudouridine1915-N3)-methyltransferase